MDANSLSHSELVIDFERYQVRVDGTLVELSATEFRVLRFLAGEPGRIFSRVQILDGVHGERYSITPRAVDVQIAGLRRKLGPAACRIETIRGFGYRLTPDNVEAVAIEAGLAHAGKHGQMALQPCPAGEPVDALARSDLGEQPGELPAGV